MVGKTNTTGKEEEQLFSRKNVIINNPKNECDVP